MTAAGDEDHQMNGINEPGAAALFDKFGYTVPTTWEQYAALSTQLATQHPGYVVGSCGDTFCPNVYYRASSCPGYKLSGQVDISVTVATDPNCARVTS